MFLNWAREFAINGPTHLSNLGLVELIRTITVLDFSHYFGINTDRDQFGTLIHLPFSSTLAHLNLSKTLIGDSSGVMETLSHPIFQHLVTLDLSCTYIGNIDPLFNAPHSFPNLHNRLSIPQIATTTQFPNLKVLDLTATIGTQGIQL